MDKHSVEVDLVRRSTTQANSNNKTNRHLHLKSTDKQANKMLEVSLLPSVERLWALGIVAITHNIESALIFTEYTLYSIISLWALDYKSEPR